MIIILLVSLLYSGSWIFNFSSSDRENYNIESELTLKWDEDYEVVYLNYTTPTFFLLGNSGYLSSISNPGEKKGFAFYPTEDMFITNFSRYSDKKLTQVNLWRKNPYDGRPNIYASVNVKDESSWSSGLPGVSEPEDFFLLSLYPLLAHTTYWIASVGDGEGKWGVVTPSNFGTSKIKFTVFDEGKSTSYFYDPTTDPTSLSLVNSSGLSQLEGVPDLQVSQFDNYGVLVTTGFDTTAKKVQYKNFELHLSSDIYKINIIEQGWEDVSTYYLKFEPDFKGRVSTVKIKLEFQDSDDGNFDYSIWTQDITSLSRRFIRFRMTLETDNRGITPVVDGITINYNCHPQKNSLGYGEKPEDSSLVLIPQPEFSWLSFYDADGDTITYHFELSLDTGFTNIVVSTNILTNSFKIEEPLIDDTTYYWRILGFDVYGASSTYSPIFKFKTSLTPFALSAKSFEDYGRYLYDEIQTITLTFSKEVDLSTFLNSVSIFDEYGNNYTYSFTPATGFSDTVYIQLPELPSSQKYLIHISTSLIDYEGLNLVNEENLYFIVLKKKDESYSISYKGAEIVIPENSSSDNYYIERDYYVFDENPELKSTIDVVKGTGFIIPVSSYTVSFKGSDSRGNYFAEFQNEITVSLPYPDSDDDGYLDGIEIDVPVESARIFYRDSSSGQWVLLPGEQWVDKSKKRVYAKTKILSSYTVMVYPSQPESQIKLRNIPNPFRAGNETTITYYLDKAKKVNVRIYNLIGDVVWEREFPEGDPVGGHSGINSFTWNGKNKDGMLLGTGIYILEIDAGGEKIRRKIGVYR